MKSLFHSFLLPLVAGFLLFSCTQETPKSEMSTSVPPSKAGRMIQLQIESGVTLPEVEYPTKPRLSRVDLDISHSKYRPSVNFSKTALQTRLYLRKKGSTRPEDIFCVIIRPQDWTKKTVENRKLILQGLSTGDKPFAKDVPAGKSTPQPGEQWEAAAILGSGDKPKSIDKVFLTKPRSLIFSTSTPQAYEQSNKARQLNWDTSEGEEEEDANEYIPDPTMDILYTADWTDVSIDAQGIVGIKLSAKPAGAILHYDLKVLDPTDVPDKSKVKPFPSHMEGTISPPPLDMLSTSIGTWYGVLYYDQRGTAVHWEHGEALDWGNTPNDFLYDGTSPRLDHDKVKQWTQCLYFAMPPHDDGLMPGATNQPATFSLMAKEWAVSSRAYRDVEAFYLLRKRGSSGAWSERYVSGLAQLKKGAIHYVALEAKRK